MLGRRRRTRTAKVRTALSCPCPAKQTDNGQNFVLKVSIVITSKVFADFRFESPISIDFHDEILALLPPKSANTFAPSIVCRLSFCGDSREKSMQTFEGAKVFANSRGKSLQTLEVITPEFRLESLY